MTLNILLEYNPFLQLYNSILPKSQLFLQLINYATKILSFQSLPTTFKKISFLVGAIALTWQSAKFLQKFGKLSRVILQNFNKERNINEATIKEQFGDNNWVVITGFTDGIGWALAQQYANLNQNLILIGRNEEKMAAKTTILEQFYPKIKILTYKCDLSKVNEIDSLCVWLETISKVKNIGVAINNAGLAFKPEAYLNLKPNQLQELFTTNFISSLKITQVMSKIFLEEKERRENSFRRVIINVSSAFGRHLGPNVGTYSISKLQITQLSKILWKELSPKGVEVLVASPFGVSTNMMGMRKNNSMISPKQCALAIISDMISKKSQSYTALNHQLQGYYLDQIFCDEVQKFDYFNRMQKTNPN